MNSFIRSYLASGLALALAAIAVHPNTARAQSILFTGTETTILLPAGTYEIEAAGGQGGLGSTSFRNNTGGLGAYVAGTFTISTGTTVTVMAGTQGGAGFFQSGGGGGGSFVVVGGVPILAAGGGGGGTGSEITGAGGPGLLTEDGGSGSNAGGSAGSGGSTGTDFSGGGGGGLLTDGSSVGSLGNGGASFLDGGAGGNGNQGGNGGFGGGGGGNSDAFSGGGGGGGYSGGAGGSDQEPGLGGGSYISATLTSTNGESGIQSGDGFVRITAPIGTVVAQNDPVPGVPNGRFVSVDNPSLDGTGDFIFKAIIGAPLKGMGGSKLGAPIRSQNNQGIWLYQNGVGSLIARTGTAAPNGNNDFLVTVSDPVMDGQGAYGFAGGLSGISFVSSLKGARQALWLSQPGGSPQVYASYSEPGAGQQEAAYTIFPQFVVSQPDGLAFFAKLTGNEVTSQSNLGLFGTDLSGSSSIVTRTGLQLTLDDSAPTIESLTAFMPPADVTGQSLSADTINGNLTFNVKFTSGDASIFLANPVTSGFKLFDIANIGGTAIGVAPARWGAFGPPAVNANASVAFLGSIKQRQVSKGGLANTSGIWVDSGTDTFMQLQAYTGWAAPSNSGTYSTFSDPVLNNNDYVAFTSILQGKPRISSPKEGAIIKNEAVFLLVSGTPVLVTRLGLQAPGLPDSTSTFSAFLRIVLPDNSGPIILATATGFRTKPVTGLWRSDTQGHLTLIVATGQTVLVHQARKIIRTISAFQSVPTVSGQSRNFSAANGNVVLMATFSDFTWAVLNTNIIP